MTPEHADFRRVPTISRVCSDTLVELVYDPLKRRTALAVSRFDGLWNIEQEIKIETGEVLVPYTPTNNLIANGCVLFPSMPEHHGTKAELIADIRDFLRRYVELSPEFETIAAYYVLLTWVHDAFNEVPYVRLRGDYGTGKTRGLLAIGSLCYKPFFASGASTVSPVFHTLDAFGGTLVLDEADFAYSDARAEIVKLLNNGTVKGMPVLRTVVNRHKEFNPRAFNVFGPKLLAMRGAFQDRALESRFLTEEMGTRPLRADIPIHLPDSLKEEALGLRNRLLHYRFCEFYRLKTDTSALVEGIEPRLNQTAISLLTMTDSKEARDQLQRYLLAAHAESVAARRASLEGIVLAALASAVQTASGLGVGVQEVTERTNALLATEGSPPLSHRSIGHILRARLQLHTRKSHGVYIVPMTEYSKVEALAPRYGIALSGKG